MAELSAGDQQQIESPLVDLQRPFLVGDHRVDPHRREISRDGKCTAINPKDLEVLRELARRPGHVIPKRALFAAVWGDQIVGDNTLTNSIHQLRKAFDDDSRNASVIRTVHRRGYELVARVAEAPEEAPAASLREVLSGGRRSFNKNWYIWLFIAALVLVILAVRLIGQDSSLTPVRLTFSLESRGEGEADSAQLQRTRDEAQHLLMVADNLRPVEPGETAKAEIRARVTREEVLVEVVVPGQPTKRFHGSRREDGASNRSVRAAVVQLDASVAGDESLVARMLEVGSVSRRAFEATTHGDAAWARFDYATADSHYDAVLGVNGIDEEDPYACERRARLYEALLLVESAAADLRRAAESVKDRGVGGSHRMRLELRSERLAGRLAAAKRLLEHELQSRAYDVTLQSTYAWQLFMRERDCSAALAILDRLFEQSGLVEVPEDLAILSFEASLICGNLREAARYIAQFESDVRAKLGVDEVDREGAVPLVNAWVALTSRNLERAGTSLGLIPKSAMRSWRETFEGDLAFIRRDISAALKHYRLGAASILAVDQIRGFLRGAMARLVDGQAAEARHQAENAREVAFLRVAEPEADALLTDQMMQIRGVLGLASLAAGDVPAARAEAARLEAMLALRAARNGGDIKYDRYREEWAHLVAGALLLHDGDREAAEARYRQMLAVRPYDEPNFLPFLERLAETDAALAVVVNEMRGVLGFEPLDFVAQARQAA